MGSGGHRRGVAGEEIARRYLLSLGYRLIVSNFRSRWGEIDIVAQDEKGDVVFCEVKSFQPGAMVNPLEAVTPAKVRKISRTSEFFLVNYPQFLSCYRHIEVVVTDGIRVVEHVKDIW